ncbi:MAG TPA: acyl-CoA dehydrogenase family protein [Balneolales bacterium]|nr:acyl-CoA dehydrogenase family protein [Balneolales bacterium]
MKTVHPATILEEDSKNRVLEPNAGKSSNFYHSDHILQSYLKKHMRADALKYMTDKLEWIGEEAATQMNLLSAQADQNGPVIKKRTPYGEDLEEIEFHPSYWKLMDMAAETEMFYVKWDPDLRKKFSNERHLLGFSVGHLYAMTELGVYCPLCMTDGAARLLDLFADDEDKHRLIPGLSSRNGKTLLSGAMFLTEKAGGSDVGANRTMATHLEGKLYRLNGEKWFCSNANAHVMMVLARSNEQSGTKGLSLFLVEKTLPDGTRNPMEYIRLKEKMGVRSMATAEIKLKDTIGKLIGEEGKGFKMMTEMINLSRLYNSVTAVAGSRRALIEAYEFLTYRKTFGKTALEHALIRDKLWELGSLHIVDFLLVWKTIQTMDAADNGDERSAHLNRILIPMSKWFSAETSVYIGRESMELMGGMGYIEDTVMPRIYRDLLVLPIWEGSGNIIVLDVLRASQKTKGMQYLLEDIQKLSRKSEKYGDIIQKELAKVTKVLEALPEQSRDSMESSAKPIFKRLIYLWQMALMIEEMDQDNRQWIELALEYMSKHLHPEKFGVKEPPSVETIQNLIGWELKY